MRESNFYQPGIPMAGANPMWVAEQLGHTSMAMVLTVYSKWIDDADKSKERGKIDSMFGGIATHSLQEKAAAL